MMNWEPLARLASSGLLGLVLISAVAVGGPRLAFLEAVVDGASGVDGLWGASSVAVSPAGNHVYASAYSDNAVTALLISY
jgi:DNA-binding beta-propeller fold protein YncE